SAMLGLEKNSADKKSPPDENKILTTHSLAESFKHSVNILLVEDNPVNQKMAKIMLSKAGYSVEIAGNGVQAVSRFIENFSNFDMIFMDINMPEMDGLEATRRIRELERERNYGNTSAQDGGAATSDTREAKPSRMPIVALTANAMKEFEDKCIEVGMDDFLTKPLKRELVFKAIQKWVKHV
ncbi:MAG: response regulator, partial [Desulfamplus sp.]|nr:response regulator [Desulfamplus sp.]